MRFSIRDLLWLTTLVGVLIAWGMHEGARVCLEATLRAELATSRRSEVAWRRLYWMANSAFLEQARFYGELNKWATTHSVPTPPAP